MGYVGLHVRPCRDAFLRVSSCRDTLQRDQVYTCAWRAGTCDPKRQVGSASHGGSREACSLGSLLSRPWSLHHTGKEVALQAPPVAHTGLVSGARFKAISFGGGKHQEDLCHFLPGDRPRTRQQQGPGAGRGPVAVAAGKWGPQEGVAQPQAAPGPWAPRASSPGQTQGSRTGAEAWEPAFDSPAPLPQEGSSTVTVGGQRLSLTPDESLLVPAGTE